MRLNLMAALAAAAALPAFAQTSSIVWELRNAAGVPVQPVVRTTTQALCDSAARARGLSAEYDCTRITRVTAAPPAPTCPAAPAPETRQTACPVGTEGLYSQSRTATMGPPTACVVTWSAWQPEAPPPGSCPAIPPPPPPSNALHFSDCQAGAAAGCVPGNDANPGTAALPKRVPTTAIINALPAGGQILLARGGAWAQGAILEFHNLNATPAAPVVMDAYGSGPLPVLTFSASIGLQFGGRWGNTSMDGGYTVRNVMLRGLNAATADTRGVWLVQNVRNVVLENMVFDSWRTGLQIQPNGPGTITGFVLRNSRVLNSRSFGMLYSGDDGVIEGNHFEGNNTSGSAMLHALYINGGGRNNVIRGNRFVRNSVVGGVCTGGNVTAHGNIDGMLVEGNTIEQDSGSDQCGGFNFTAAYPEVEAFRNLVVRGNTIRNVGPGAVIVDSAPEVVIEGNRSINARGRSHTVAYNYGSTSETPMTNPVVRNNTLCGSGSITNLPGAIVSGNRQLALTDPACTAP